MPLHRFSAQTKIIHWFHGYQDRVKVRLGNFYRLDEACNQLPYLQIPKASLCIVYRVFDKDLSI